MADLYQVEAVIGKRVLKNRKLEYLLKWKNYPFEESTWEAQNHCQYIRNLIRGFDYKIQGEKLPYTTEDYQLALSKARNNKKSRKLYKTSVKREALQKASKSQASTNQSIHQQKRFWNSEDLKPIFEQNHDDDSLTVCEEDSRGESDSQDSEEHSNKADGLFPEEAIDLISLQSSGNSRQAGSISEDQSIHEKQRGDSPEGNMKQSLSSELKAPCEEQTKAAQIGHPQDLKGQQEGEKQYKFPVFFQFLKVTADLFESEYIYRVEMSDGSLREMSSKELIREYPKWYVRFLERLVKFQ